MLKISESGISEESHERFRNRLTSVAAMFAIALPVVALAEAGATKN
jgi:hypothetical protein